jgi:hypothetical protein
MDIMLLFKVHYVSLSYNWINFILQNNYLCFFALFDLLNNNRITYDKTEINKCIFDQVWERLKVVEQLKLPREIIQIISSYLLVLY